MQSKRNTDTPLINSIAAGMTDMISLFPRKMMGTDQIIRKFRLPWSNIQILMMLRERSVTLSEISDALGIAKPNVTPLIDKLIGKNLVCKSSDESDHRMVNVALTDEGKNITEEIQRDVASHFTEWSSGLNHSELKELNNAISTILRLAKTSG